MFAGIFRQDRLTYKQLQQQVAELAGLLARMGVAKGDRVLIYMPMVPEAAIAMLACARIGAPHSVVFGGFSAEALLMSLRRHILGNGLVVAGHGGARNLVMVDCHDGSAAPLIDAAVVVGL